MTPELHHATVVDPAMSAAERAEIHRVYREFADEVKAARRMMSWHEFVPPAEVHHGRFRLAAKYIAVSEAPGGLFCPNWCPRERFLLAPAWRSVIAWLAARAIASLAEFEAAFGATARAADLAAQLVEHCLLLWEASPATGTSDPI